MRNISSPAYLINLDRHPERRDASFEQFRSIGIDVTRIAAVDYRELDAQTIRSVVDNSPTELINRELSPGEVACFLSHIKVWKKIAEGSAAMAWIFEDDVSFCEGARDTLAEIESRAQDWDMVRLYSHKPVAMETVEPLSGRYAIGLARRYPMSTIAYAITRPAADHLVRTMTPFSLPVDTNLKRWWVHGLCTKVVTPSVCKPRNDEYSASTLDVQRKSAYTGNPLTRFAKNLRYQIYLRRAQQVHAADFPRAKRFP